MDDRFSKCCTCGKLWVKGQDGNHSCSEYLLKKIEMLEDLNRFMCSTWVDIDKWAHENMDANSLGSYPQIQGTRNQLNLGKIAEQKCNLLNIAKGVKIMLESQEASHIKG